MHISIASKHRGRRHPRGFEPLRIAVAGLLAAQLAFLPLATAAGDKPASALAPVSTNDPVLRAMQTELARATTELGKSEQPPYYLSYTVYDQDFVVLAGAYGSLLGSNNVHRRFADVTMRVGSPDLDNTHGQSRSSGVTSGTLPIGDDQDAIARVLWELTDREYKRAVRRFLPRMRAWHPTRQRDSLGRSFRRRGLNALKCRHRRPLGARFAPRAKVTSHIQVWFPRPAASLPRTRFARRRAG